MEVETLGVVCRLEVGQRNDSYCKDIMQAIEMHGEISQSAARGALVWRPRVHET